MSDFGNNDTFAALDALGQAGASPFGFVNAGKAAQEADTMQYASPDQTIEAYLRTPGMIINGVNNALGTGIDWGIDRVGDFAGALAGDDARNFIQGATNATDIANILTVPEAMAAATLGGPVGGLAFGAALGADDFANALFGHNAAGEELSDQERSTAGISGLIDTGLGAFGGGMGLFGKAGKFGKDIAKQEAKIAASKHAAKETGEDLVQQEVKAAGPKHAKASAAEEAAEQGAKAATSEEAEAANEAIKNMSRSEFNDVLKSVPGASEIITNTGNTIKNAASGRADQFFRGLASDDTTLRQAIAPKSGAMPFGKRAQNALANTAKDVVSGIPLSMIGQIANGEDFNTALANEPDMIIPMLLAGTTSRGAGSIASNAVGNARAKNIARMAYLMAMSNLGNEYANRNAGSTPANENSQMDSSLE